jgi:2-methylcitrate dehydratase
VKRDDKATASTITALARMILATDAHAISAAALKQAQLLLLDTIGCGLAGTSEAVTRTVTDIALRSSGNGKCTLIGRPEKTGVLGAVLANGVAVRVLDLNDYLIGEAHGQPESGGHPSDNIPVALAAGAACARTGREILAAIVIGYELYARLQRLMDRAGNWDGVTVSGLVAPAIAGRLMGLDETRLAHALALGAARAATPSIVRSGDISAAKSVANALVAQAGMQAALLAQGGLTGPLAVLDDARGLRGLFVHGDVSAVLPAPVPADSAVLHAHVKAYPCVNTAQSAVAAALKLHALLKGSVENLSRIEVTMADYPVVKRHQEDPGRIRPMSREAADHSISFLIAVSLIDGAFGVAQFENERWRDPRVVHLMEKIVLSRDAAWNTRAPGTYPCSIRAWDVNRREHAVEVPYPPGFSRGRFDETAVVDKFHAIVEPVLARDDRVRIVEAVLEFDHSPSSAKLDAAIAKGRITN